MEFGQEVLPQQVGGVALMEKVGELHPSWRRWAGSASPHMTSLGGSQIQEAVSKGGERTLDPVEHWRLPQPWRIGGQLPTGCGGPSLLRHDDGDDDQELVARMVVQLQTGATQSPA